MSSKPWSIQIQRADKLLTYSSRTLLVLNSGAIISVMGLLQALYRTCIAAGFKYFATLSCIFFVIGIISSIWMLWSSYEFTDAGRQIKTSFLTSAFANIQKKGNAQRNAFMIGITCFLVGALTALLGVVIIM